MRRGLANLCRLHNEYGLELKATFAHPEQLGMPTLRSTWRPACVLYSAAFPVASVALLKWYNVYTSHCFEVKTCVVKVSIAPIDGQSVQGRGRAKGQRLRVVKVRL
jgi:hypothetical protein